MFPYQKELRHNVFERICIPPIEPEGTRFDFGFVAESLLFYSETFLIVSANYLSGLVRHLGPDLLFRLMDEHQLQVRCHRAPQTGPLAGTINWATSGVGLLTGSVWVAVLPVRACVGSRGLC